MHPDIAGLDPIYFDFRLIARTANLIRLLAQTTRYGGILYIMGVKAERADLIMSGCPFTEKEIYDNEALLTFLATQTLSGVYSNIKTIFN